MRSFAVRAALLAAAALSAAASAHHSLGSYNTSQLIFMSGTIREFQPAYPHSWLYVISEADGSLWSFETGSPSELQGIGIRADTFPVGAKVTVYATPLRDGGPGGHLSGVSLPDGRMFPVGPKAPRVPVQ